MLMRLEEIEQRIQNHSQRVLQTDLPKAAVLIPLATTLDGRVSELIFTRRSSHMTTHSGEVAFPGGKRDPEDPDLTWTALRESQEEVNLAPSNVKVLGRLGPVVSRFGIEVTPFIGSVPESVELQANTSELDRIFRVPLDFLADTDNLRFDQWKMQDKTYSMPSYQFGEYHIWGLTAIMLVEFMNAGCGIDVPLDAPMFTPKYSHDTSRRITTASS